MESAPQQRYDLQVMSAPSASNLEFRFGCPLALLITAAFVIGIELVGYGRMLRADSWLFPGAFIAVPFGILALTKVHDWLAWLFAVGLTAGIWTYHFYSKPQGVDFRWGLVMMFAPLVIAGVSLAVAGMRGRITWAVEGNDRTPEAGL